MTETPSSTSPELSPNGPEPRVLDVRPLIAQGEEPFETIMAAVGELQGGQDLVVVAPFEPTPLEGVLSGQGFTYRVTELGGGDWQVCFTRAG